jgi:rRNA-processing protein FCF1
MSAYGASFSLFDDLAQLLSQSHTIVVPELVSLELAGISRGGGKAAVAARLALDLVSGLEEASTGADHADQEILLLAERYGRNVVVCTNDGELKNILKARGTMVVGVRDYSHLDFL